MRKSSCIVALAASLAGISPSIAAPAPTPTVQKVKAIIAKRMLDPASLQLRSTRVVTAQINGTPQQVMCGEYNSKNKFGGYVGFETFVYETTTLRGVLTFNMRKIGLFAEGNGMDFDSDPTAAVRAGVPGAVLDAQAERTFALAKLYLPLCLG